MAEARLQIEIDGDPDGCRAGEPIRGHIIVDADRELTCLGVRLAGSWRFELRKPNIIGRTIGSKERAEATVELPGGRVGPGATLRVPFELAVPGGPPTYDGRNFRCRWRLRATAESDGGPVDPAIRGIRVVNGDGRGQAYRDSGAWSPERIYRDDYGRATFFTGWALSGIFVPLGGFLLLLATGLLSDRPIDADDVAILAIMGIAVLALGFGLLFYLTWSWWAERAIGRVEARIDPTELHRGGSVRLHLVIRPRRRVDIDGVRAGVIAYEKYLTGGGGNATYRDSEPVFERLETLSEHRSLVPGEVIDLSRTFEVPLETPPTIQSTGAWLLPAVLVHIRIPGQADWKRRHVFTLHP